MTISVNAVQQASAGFPKPAGYKPSYGTAGFRTEASMLPSTVFRCGLLIGLRALSTGAACGVMITASHNVDTDNGVKLVDPSGEMLEPVWEDYATLLAQAETDADLVSVLSKIAEGHPEASKAGQVVIGRDTRSSGPGLFEAAKAGVKAMGVAVVDIGVVTTPQLHFAVQSLNQYGSYEEHMFFTALVESYRTLAAGTPASSQPMHVDCANGVGAPKLQQIAPQLSSLGLELQLYNTGDGRLNHECGADYVQKEQTFPAGMSSVPEGATCCSIDGDADRVVFFTRRGDQFVLLDGDKIASLCGKYLQGVLSHAPPEARQGMKMGVVQTAYANGASTSFLTQELHLKVACTPTGVKFLHHEAKHFDIGIYFESNGHGTVLFAPKWLQQLRTLDENVAALQVLAVSRLMNQAVGDALGGALLVEVILRSGTTLDQWAALYSDLPSKQTKLTVADRTAITTTDAERRVVTPEGLQDAIDALVAQVPRGRAFARPSGTEDAVRVYAEAETKGAADQLATDVARAVYDLAGGTGKRP